MRITESKLRQIIREEAELRIVKDVITEVVSEMRPNITERQRLMLEASVLDCPQICSKKSRSSYYSHGCIGIRQPSSIECFMI